MKKLFSVLLLSLTFISPVSAEVFLKYGAVVSDKPDNTTWAGIWLEQNNCSSCLSLFGIELHNENDLISNRIAGVDFTQKFFETDSGVVRASVGYGVSEKDINESENFNFHLGLSLVGKKVLFNKYDVGLYYDHFSNGKRVLDRGHIPRNEPLDLMSIGVSF